MMNENLDHDQRTGENRTNERDDGLTEGENDQDRETEDTPGEEERDGEPDDGTAALRDGMPVRISQQQLEAMIQDNLTVFPEEHFIRLVQASRGIVTAPPLGHQEQQPRQNVRNSIQNSGNVDGGDESDEYPDRDEQPQQQENTTRQRIAEIMQAAVVLAEDESEEQAALFLEQEEELRHRRDNDDNHQNNANSTE